MKEQWTDGTSEASGMRNGFSVRGLGRPPSALGVAALVAAATFSACGPGRIGDAGPSIGGPAVAGPTGGSSGGSSGGSTVQCVQGAAFAPPRLWRLNDRQYANVVHDVFGAGIAVPADVSAATPVGAEEPSTDTLSIDDDSTVRNYLSSAQSTAASAVQNLTALLGCSTTDATCVETFLRSKVARAFRRPLTDDEVQGMLALYQLGAQDSPSAGVQALMTYVLQSPNFLWRTELGVNPLPGAASGPATGPTVPLGPFELAAALSFLFLDSVPDDTLWADAAAGTLTQPSVEAAEVDRLMGLAVAKSTVAGMVGSWLAIHKIEAAVKDATLFPQFTSAVRDELLQSSQMFLGDIVLGGTLTDLITSSKIYLNADLATIYGIDGVTGTTLLPVTVGLPQWSGGILTQPAILAANDTHPNTTDVVHRGLFIYNSMICGASIPAPPSNAAAVNASLPATATERDRAVFRDSNSECRGCHGLFDPLGLLTERYDAIGRYSAVDSSGKPIDQSSTITLGVPALDGPADGLPDLITRLKSTRQLSDCTAGNLASIAVGRIVTADKSCALQTVRDTFAKNGSFAELFRSLATSPAFLNRDANLQ
jgi:hypothetical protein